MGFPPSSAFTSFQRDWSNFGETSRRAEKENCDMAKKREFPLAQVYGLLEPGPVVLVTTARAGERTSCPCRD